MKTKDLFGVKFINSPHYSAQILADFKNWKKTRQETLDFEDKQLQLLIRRYMEMFEEESNYMEGRTYEDREEQLMKKLNRDVSLKGWDGVFEEELQDPIRRKYCNISYEEAQELLKHEDCEHY